MTPWTAAHQVSPSFIVSQSLLKLISIELVMPSNHLMLYRPLLLLPSVLPIRIFSSESKYLSFSFSISTSNKYSGLISFRMGWLDLLAVQRTLKSLLQPPSSKVSILWPSAFFMVQLSCPFSPEYSLEALMLKLKLQYFGHLMRRADSFEKTLVLGKTEGGTRRR